jgi:hypothetical protein
MKQQLLFTLFSALVNSSFGSNEYDIFCEVRGVREAAHCNFAIPNTGDLQTGENEITVADLLEDALHSCVRAVTHDDVDFQLMEPVPEGGRQLRVNDIPQARLLGGCSILCCTKPACVIQGLCGSTSSCSQSGSRRLQGETDAGTGTTDSASVTRDLQLVEEAPAPVELALSTKCTQSVRALGELLGWNNRCLGIDPSVVTCAVTEYYVPEL